MTVISRRVVAIPARSASSAWAVVINLVTATGSAARTELSNITGIASCLISEEALKTAPCVIYGSGPRVLVYCLYGDDAITGEDANEGALTFTPTEGSWHMSLPCPPDDLDWVEEALKKHSTHVVARQIGAAVNQDEEEQSDSSISEGGVVVDKEAFLRS